MRPSRARPPISLAAALASFALACGLGIGACALPTGGLSDQGAGGSTAASTSAAASGGGESISVTVSAGTGTGTTGTTGTGTSAATGSGGGSACPAGYDCVTALTKGAFAGLGPDGAPCPAGWGGLEQIGDGMSPGCEDCTCGAEQNGACKPGDVTGWAYHTCSDTKFSYTGLSDGQCVDVTTGATAPHSFKVKPSTPIPGSCAPAGGGKKALTASTLCHPSAMPTMACGAGMVCVPSASPFKLCAEPPKMGSCEQGWMPQMVMPVTGDDRVCSCACAPPMGDACDGAFITLHDNDGCNGGALQMDPANDPTCNANGSMSINNALRAISVHAGTLTAGSCMAQPKAMGSVKFGPPTLLCCPP
jgi:hypothetical protein